MAITITDVARLAGVSIKTVSRVLNREPHVRPAMHERVMAAVSELNYRPNASARALAGARSYLIGLYYDNPSRGYVSTSPRRLTPIEDLGPDTPRASGLLCMAIVGGAVIPLLTGRPQTRSASLALIVPLVCYLWIAAHGLICRPGQTVVEPIPSVPGQ